MELMSDVIMIMVMLGSHIVTGAHYFESFAPIGLKFWHNIFEMLNFKKMWKKNQFSESAYPFPPPPPLRYVQ